MQIRSLEGMSNFTCSDNDFDNFKGLCLELQLKEIVEYLVEHNSDKVAGLLYLHELDDPYDVNKTTNWIKKTHTVCGNSTARYLLTKHTNFSYWDQESKLECN